MKSMFEKAQNVIVLSPTTEVLTLGLGSGTEPIQFPNKIAYFHHGKQESNSSLINHHGDAEDVDRRQGACQDIIRELKLPCDQAPVVVREEEEESVSMETDQHVSVLLGEELLDLKDTVEYKIVSPLCINGLDRSQSDTRLRQDLALIWSRAISVCLGISDHDFDQYGVVLLIPESLSLPDMELMSDVLLVDLSFKELVIHATCTAALFGQGISSGCVVNLESDSIRVICVEDGIVISKSAQFLPFGGCQITEALAWLLQENGVVLSCSCETPYGQQMLQKVKDGGCFLPTEDSEEALESHLKSGTPVRIQGNLMESGKTISKEISLGIASCVPPMGLFYPSLFPRTPPVFLCKTYSLSETYYSGILDQQNNSRSKPSIRTLVDSFESIPLDSAIVRSISSAEKVEQRRRFYTSILLVGPSSNLKGLTDMLERRVLSALPTEEVIDTVAVLETKWPSHHTIWKGGCVFGVLTPTDQWIQGKEWKEGVNLDRPGKYGKTDVLRSKAFWMIKTELGFD
eukprot:g2810.t1